MRNKTLLTKVSLVVVFIILGGIYTYILNERTVRKENDYLNFVSEKYQFAYNTIYEQHKQMAETLYTGIINRYHIREIYEQLETATPAQKDALRQELLKRVLPRYKELKSLHLRQLHFHLANNESFMRLHRPEKFGDDLTGIRKTVEFVNKYHKPIDGFENGRIFDGYRYVFPISSKSGKHLGSMEISFAPVALTSAMMTQFRVLSNFYIDKKLITGVVFKDEETRNYTNSHHEGYMFDKEVLQALKEKTGKTATKLKPSDKNTKRVLANALQERVLSFADPALDSIFTNIPIMTPIENKMAAFFTVRSKDYYIPQIHHDFRKMLALGLLLIGSALMLYYQQFSARLLFQESSEKLKTQQAALKASEKKFRSVFQKSASGMARLDTNGNFLEVNDTFCELLGYSHEDMEQKSYMDITHDEDKDRSTTYYEKLRSGIIDSKKTDKRYIKTDGSVIWVSLVLNLVRNSNDEPDYCIAGIQDITQRIESNNRIAAYQKELESINKNLEHLIIEETKKRVAQAGMFKQMFNSLDSYVFVFNKEYALEFANDAFFALYHLHEKDAAGKHIRNIFGYELYQEIADNSEKVFTGETVTLTKEILLPSGKKIYADITNTPFRESYGAISGVIVSMIDITDKKKMMEDLSNKEHLMIQQSKLADMGSMIGAIAHQWKQPLNIIGLSMSLFRENHENDDEVETLSLTITDQINYMSQTINDFRDFYNPSKIKMKFNVYDSIIKVNNLMYNKFKVEKIDISIKGDKDAVAFGFQNEFIQVVMNIINNARDAILDKKEKNGRIDINITSEKGSTTIVVSDNGVGIPKDLLPNKLFEQFVSSKGERGTGIGLSMSKTIIEKFMNGSISAQNTKDGAVFSIILPSEEEIETQDVKHNIGILFVEDDDFTRKSMGLILEKSYYKVFTASDGVEGLALFEKHKDDITIIVTDVDMPNMNGIEMAKAIRKVSKKVPIIVTTAIKQDVFENVGFSAIFEKPVNIKLFNETVFEILS